MERTRDDARVGPGRCPYCKDLVGDDPKEVVACAACGARHHAGCHDEHGSCATCASTEVLIPRARARRARLEPPRGSTIVLARDPADGALRYALPVLGRAERIAQLIVCVMLPILLPILYFGWRWRRRSLVLRKDGIDLVGGVPGGLGPRRVVARRDEIGAIRLERVHGALRLTVDVGVDRVRVDADGWSGRLKEPEVEWLHELLLAWKDEGLDLGGPSA